MLLVGAAWKPLQRLPGCQGALAPTQTYTTMPFGEESPSRGVNVRCGTGRCGERRRNVGGRSRGRQIANEVVTMPGMKNFSSYGLGESFAQGEC